MSACCLLMELRQVSSDVQGKLKTTAKRIRREVYTCVECLIHTSCPWFVPPASRLSNSLARPGPCQLRWGLGLVDCYLLHLPSSRPPQTPLGLFSGHVHSRAQGPRLHRHHAVARQWRKLLIVARYAVQLEQDILLDSTGSKRAELVARHDNGDQL